jgi:hypothetical protein
MVSSYKDKLTIVDDPTTFRSRLHLAFSTLSPGRLAVIEGFPYTVIDTHNATDLELAVAHDGWELIGVSNVFNADISLSQRCKNPWQTSMDDSNLLRCIVCRCSTKLTTECPFGLSSLS